MRFFRWTRIAHCQSLPRFSSVATSALWLSGERPYSSFHRSEQQEQRTSFSRSRAAIRIRKFGSRPCSGSPRCRTSALSTCSRTSFATRTMTSSRTRRCSLFHSTEAVVAARFFVSLRFVRAHQRSSAARRSSGLDRERHRRTTISSARFIRGSPATS